MINFCVFKRSSWFRAACWCCHCFWSGAEENVTSWGMPWVKTNVCGGTCFSVVTEAGSRVPASLVNHLAVTILIICFTVFIFHRRLSVYFVVAFFPFLFCCFPLTPARVVFAWRKSASTAFSGTGWAASANRSLSFHRITTMFQFV